MKKNVKKIIAAILSFVFLFSGVFAIMSSADTTEERTTCIKDHFDKLNYNKEEVPPNMDGTCVFVAMSMLLGYYDSYWNDNFIQSMDNGITQMDWESGVYNSRTDTLSQTFNAGLEVDTWEVYNGTNRQFSSSFKNQYLQSFLLEISKEMFLILEVALLDVQVKQVLEYYLYDVCGFTQEQVTVNYQHQLTVGDDTLYDTMKEQISLGNPVIYFGLDVDCDPSCVDNDKMNLYGHAMIAYDVTTNIITQEEDVKLHTGWNDTPNYDYVKTTDFSHNNSIIWLDIDKDALPHECTDAYVDRHNDSVYYCACQIYPHHSEHENNHLLTNDYNETAHYQKCFCGYTANIQPHIVDYYYYDSERTHGEACVCGFCKIVDHNHKNYECIDSLSHEVICDCGDVRKRYGRIRSDSRGAESLGGSKDYRYGDSKRFFD